MTQQRKHWIDLLRGFCMIAILLDHTELYYTGVNIIDYNFYVVNALTIFFMLSGYLMYKETGFDVKKKIKSIARSLLLPYLIFSFLISLSKAWVYGNDINLIEIFTQIILGKSSWFVAALILSEFVFTVVLWISRGNIIAIAMTGIIGFILSISLSQGNQPYIWQFDNSMQALLFLCVGYTYHRYEKVFNPINHPIYIALLLILLICIKIAEHFMGVNMMIWYIDINNYPFFLLDVLTCCLCLIHLCKRLPVCKYVEWTGEHSLVYYFLCGGVPLIISKLMIKVGLVYQRNYLYVMTAFVFVYIVTTIITWLIYRYLPFMAGKLKYHKNLTIL